MGDYEDEQMESQSKAELAKWRRVRAGQEDAHGEAVRRMKVFLKKAIRDQQTKNNVSRELVDYMRGRRQGTINTKGGYDAQYQDPDAVVSPEGIETVTGYNARPWEENEDYYDEE